MPEVIIGEIPSLGTFPRGWAKYESFAAGSMGCKRPHATSTIDRRQIMQLQVIVNPKSKTHMIHDILLIRKILHDLKIQ